jgi:hypothetical protein
MSDKLATISACYEPSQEYVVELGEENCRKPGISSLQGIEVLYEPLCQTHGMKLLCFHVLFIP